MSGTARSEDLMRRREAAVPRGVGQAFGVALDRAENAEAWDADGNRYVDFATGIAVLNTGHCHPRVIAAARAQLDRYTHACFQVTPYEPYVALAERLNALVPVTPPAKTLLLSSGAEAVENAIKIARAHTRRRAVIAFGGGFHGRTYLGMALTGKVLPYKQGFGPLPADVFHVPFPSTFHGVSEADSLRALDALFRSAVDPADVAAILVEPVQGEGGFYIAPHGFLRALRELCDRHGMLLVVDEIQTGFGRTGRLFALEHAQVAADVVTLAKGLAGGFPLSAVAGRAAVMDAPAAGGLGGTYAGSPVSCAAALAVLDVIRDERLCERAVEIGTVIRERLLRLRERATVGRWIGEVRGLGAMVAVELAHERDPGRPAATQARALSAACAAHGVLVLGCGLHGNVIRFLPPLTIGKDTLAEGLDRFERAWLALAAAEAPAGAASAT